jgi:hypothetical protein
VTSFQSRLSPELELTLTHLEAKNDTIVTWLAGLFLGFGHGLKNEELL